MTVFHDAISMCDISSNRLSTESEGEEANAGGEDGDEGVVVRGNIRIEHAGEEVEGLVLEIGFGERGDEGGVGDDLGVGEGEEERVGFLEEVVFDVGREEGVGEEGVEVEVGEFEEGGMEGEEEGEGGGGVVGGEAERGEEVWESWREWVWNLEGEKKGVASCFMSPPPYMRESAVVVEVWNCNFRLWRNKTDNSVRQKESYRNMMMMMMIVAEGRTRRTTEQE
ncbi:hypothetical protein RIF29_39841 [Crotalaria pallida]|uniref:Uncharacterized protein n=1 Tax=Crotalaria pallida TaxID=3830 RepID=A0AAN9HQ54_CROPI